MTYLYVQTFHLHFNKIRFIPFVEKKNDTENPPEGFLLNSNCNPYETHSTISSHWFGKFFFLVIEQVSLNSISIFRFLRINNSVFSFKNNHMKITIARTEIKL